MDLQDQVDQEALRLGVPPCNLDQLRLHTRGQGLRQGLDLKVVHHSSEEQAHPMGAQVDLQNVAGLRVHEGEVEVAVPLRKEAINNLLHRTMLHHLMDMAHHRTLVTSLMNNLLPILMFNQHTTHLVRTKLTATHHRHQLNLIRAIIQVAMVVQAMVIQPVKEAMMMVIPAVIRQERETPGTELRSPLMVGLHLPTIHTHNPRTTLTNSRNSNTTTTMVKADENANTYMLVSRPENILLYKMRFFTRKIIPRT
ncbi:uncharacterized protein isoform X5 [Choristoneura fumiferana]|uniref:uncharacterized protein isoform X5 n=1 Tax=Choristoneura fumiferana TaxID=7141 RepID=UPI003D159CB3